jgi:transcriptional regulator with XRE-family HTH domain
MRDTWLDPAKLRTCRKNAGYSVPRLAAKLGRHYMTLYRLEWGTRDPSPELYAQIKRVLGVTDEELLPDERPASGGAA